MSNGTFPVDLWNPTGTTNLNLQIERVDIKFTREPFEYKRQEVRRVNDRGFMTTVFVLTGYYRGTGATPEDAKNDTDNFLATMQTAIKTWYDENDGLCLFPYRCGDGTHTVDGNNAWRVVIKSADFVEHAEFSDLLEYTITLLEAQ